MEILKSKASSVKVPGPNSKVYKDECIYSFDRPECPTGLYVCLTRFVGVGKAWLERYSKRTGCQLFLHMKRTKKEPSETEQVPEKVSRLAINMEGGFSTDSKHQWEEQNTIVVFPNMEEFEITNKDIPLNISLSVAGVITSVSATKQAEVAAASASWDGEALVNSKFCENLRQIPDPPQIPPKGWKCQAPGCDLTSNLWLNLTDGTILCGRRFFDGSGGNNHAVEHYNEDKNTRGPLAVKLGTITPNGKADVFSYAEDNMVLDPHLEKHMAHFGIKTTALEKTDKSMVEIEIDMNQRIGEWAILTESGAKLEPVFGPGYTGLHNLGNSCYMNSVLQLMFTIPAFSDLYHKSADMFFDAADLSAPESDLRLQLAKLCHGMKSGEYSQGGEAPILREEGSQPGITPAMFRRLVGRGHAEFSSNQQQDAQEFLLHLINLIERAHANQGLNPQKSLALGVVDRTESDGKVQYARRNEYFMPLIFPMEAATNKDEVNAYKQRAAEAEASGNKLPSSEIVRSKIPFEACVENFLSDSEVEYGSTTARKTMRFVNFPDFLLIQLIKYELDQSWQPVKLDVELDMPDEIDMSRFHGASSLQPGEVPMVAAPPAVVIDAGLVAQLQDMGFSVEGCRRAVYNTKSSGVEAAMAWVMDHMGDNDFNSPFVVPGEAPKKAAVSEDNVALVMSMGLTREQAEAGLRNTDNNVERAVDWIFSHPDGEEEVAGAAGGGDATTDEGLTNGQPKYKLAGFVSHMGSSTLCGHYVAHIREEDGRWIIYNDNKVAVSEKPPKALGYIYLYRRADV